MRAACRGSVVCAGQSSVVVTVAPLVSARVVAADCVEARLVATARSLDVPPRVSVALEDDSLADVPELVPPAADVPVEECDVEECDVDELDDELGDDVLDEPALEEVGVCEGLGVAASVGSTPEAVAVPVADGVSVGDEELPGPEDPDEPVEPEEPDEPLADEPGSRVGSAGEAEASVVAGDVGWPSGSVDSGCGAKGTVVAIVTSADAVEDGMPTADEVAGSAMMGGPDGAPGTGVMVVVAAGSAPATSSAWSTRRSRASIWAAATGPASVPSPFESTSTISRACSGWPARIRSSTASVTTSAACESVDSDPAGAPGSALTMRDTIGTS